MSDWTDWVGAINGIGMIIFIVYVIIAIATGSGSEPEHQAHGAGRCGYECQQQFAQPDEPFYGLHSAPGAP
jgi:hypothetical protein